MEISVVRVLTLISRKESIHQALQQTMRTSRMVGDIEIKVHLFLVCFLFDISQQLLIPSFWKKSHLPNVWQSYIDLFRDTFRGKIIHILKKKPHSLFWKGNISSPLFNQLKFKTLFFVTFSHFFLIHSFKSISLSFAITYPPCHPNKC